MMVSMTTPPTSAAFPVEISSSKKEDSEETAKKEDSEEDSEETARYNAALAFFNEPSSSIMRASSRACFCAEAADADAAAARSEAADADALARIAVIEARSIASAAESASAASAAAVRAITALLSRAFDAAAVGDVRANKRWRGCQCAASLATDAAVASKPAAASSDAADVDHTKRWARALAGDCGLRG